MQLDLNLLVALDALLEESSVSGAAARMHVSPPAMSRTLGRIRHMTGDEILTRTGGRRMTPTPYSMAIREEVHAIVLQAQAVLARRQTFDLLRLERTFTIQCHDALTTALGSSLLESLRKAAPRSTLRILAEPSIDAQELRQGLVDLHVGAEIPSHRDTLYSVLGEDGLVVAMRARHRLAGRTLDVRRYAAAEHITVSRRGRLRDQLDDTLSAKGLARRVVASSPTAAAALCMVSETDLLVAIPKMACAAMVEVLKLKTTELPVTATASPIVAAWHRRHEADPAHAWLREEVRIAVIRLLGPS